MDKILRELLLKDKSLLARRNELLAAIDENTPPHLWRDKELIKDVVELGIGEFFLSDNYDDAMTKFRVVKALLDENINPDCINFAVKTFERALGIGEPSAEVAVLKARVVELERELSKQHLAFDKLNKKLQASQSPQDSVAVAGHSPKKNAVPTVLDPVEKPSDRKFFLQEEFSFRKEIFSFLKEFNTMVTLSDASLRHMARQSFLKHYPILTFTCINYRERLSDPNQPPKFMDNPHGDYWAIHLEQANFAVVPSANFRVYSFMLHRDFAFGLVFASNYINGKQYRRIRVEKPAIFERNGNLWFLLSQGKLLLE